jgi:hypothetical protein
LLKSWFGLFKSSFVQIILFFTVYCPYYGDQLALCV